MHFYVFFLQLLYDKYCICCTFPWTKSKLHVVAMISFLGLRSTIFSNIFIPCSNNFMPLKFPHSSGSTFCLYMGTISLFYHSSGICSSSQTLFSISCFMSTPLSPRCLIRSIGRPEHPAAFPFFMLSMAFLHWSFYCWYLSELFPGVFYI